MSRLLEIVIKTTDACNASCVYCAAGSGPAGRRKLSIDAAQALIAQVLQLIDQGRFQRARLLWHGGEPLLLGKSFFRQLAGIAPCGHITHRIQTNLTLLDAEWIEILEPLTGSDGIGTSVDPFSDTRRLGSGDGYTRCWLDGLAMLDDVGWRVGCVYVVHSGSLDRARDVYWFFRNLRDNARLSLRVNPLLTVGRAAGSASGDLSLAPGAYGLFLRQLAGEWLADHGRLVVSPIRDFALAMEGTGCVRACDLGGRAACVDTHLGIDPDGEVHNCGRAVDAGGMRFGNLRDVSLTECLNHPSRQILREREDALLAGRCGTCGYWRMCHGGCLYESHGESERAHRPTALCEDYRLLFGWLEGRLSAARNRAGAQPGPQGAAVDAQKHAAPAAIGPQRSVEAVRTTAASGTPVALQQLRQWPADALLDLATFYLREPGLDVPVEPFHSVLVSLQPGGAACLLPAMYGEPPARPDALSACGTCEAYKSCRGFWMRPASLPDHCAAWRRIVSMLRNPGK